MDMASNNADESSASPPAGVGASSASGSVAQRWTCEACGCNTNSESDRNCTICGTRRDNGSSIMRRAGYAARASGLFGSSGATLRRRHILGNNTNHEHQFNIGNMMFDGYHQDYPGSVRDADVDMNDFAEEFDEDDGQLIADMASFRNNMAMAGEAGIRNNHIFNNRSAAVRLGVAAALQGADPRSFAPASFARESTQTVCPYDLSQAANANDSVYQPKWMNLSQISRMRTNGIEVGEAGNQNAAYLPPGSGEGRALRALEAFPRSAPFANTLPSVASQGRRTRRVFGFKVAFSHPSKEIGRNMGGGYLIGVTMASFSSFSEKNALQQSPLFYGIEDSGNKYEGARNNSSNSSSREGLRTGRKPSYGTELKESEAPRNNDGVLFGSREVVTCVVDFESRTLTFWRDEDGEPKLIGTLVKNLPRSGQLYPIVVPYYAGSTVSITGMSGRPLPLLDSFASTWKQKQLEKDIQQREKIRKGRSVMIQNGSFTPSLVTILLEIFSRYNGKSAKNLTQIEASRLWYQCGIRLSSLTEIIGDAKTTQNNNYISFKDFHCLLQRIVTDDEKHHPLLDPSEKIGDSSDFRVGEKVELASNYERFGDATNGPLLPGNRGIIIELQGEQGSRQSIRVIYDSRRWWYQPQALVCERSGLTDPPGVWFLKGILRSHGYDETKLKLLVGKDIKSSWKIGDLVAPKKLKSLDSRENPGLHGIDEGIGRIVHEISTSSPHSMRARVSDSQSVTVEFISKGFAESTCLQGSSSFKRKSVSLESRKVSTSRLVHTSTFHGLSASQKPRKAANTVMSALYNDEDDSEAIDLDDDIRDSVLSDFQKLKDLKPSAIERIIEECDKTSTSIIGLFETGMPEFVMEALACLMQRIQLSNNDESLAQAIAALGKLALRVAERSFPNECNASTEDNDQKQQPQKSQDLNPLNVISNINNAPADIDRPNENAGMSVEVPSGRDSRSLSLLQRRRVLLTLISRAQRPEDDPLTEIISRELQVLPPTEMSADAAEALFFATRSDGNNFEDHNVHFENSRPTESASSMAGKLPVQSLSNESLLDITFRGRNNDRPTSDTDDRCIIPLPLIKSIVSMGILGNSLPWLKSFLNFFAKKLSRKCNASGFPILKNASDDDGMPLLQLAITLGCSDSVIRELIRYGAPVTEIEIRLAADIDLPEVLRVLLMHQVYSDGMIDLERCSPDIAAVVQISRERQENQYKKLRTEAGSFLVSFTQKLLEICLKRRQQQQQKANDVCGRAIACALVGSMELCALRNKEKKASPTGELANEGRDDFGQEIRVSGMDPCGLLQVLPSSILGRSLAEEPSSLTNLLLLIEDYLCNKGINDGCVGLTLLLTLLQRFPQMTQSPEMERYGFAELVESHDALSLNRLSEISSRLAKRSLSQYKSEGDMLSTHEAICCPKKHVATLHVTKHSSFRCDLCHVGVECGAIMYGCRECDWDACETCTDMVEGGMMKWKYVRELSSKCQELFDQNTVLNGGDLNEECSEWATRMLENLKLMDNALEVNALSIRLLQRDPDSIQGLAHMLSDKGRVTMYQFFMVILPALHSTLMGKSLGSEQTTGRRTKKPRVAGIRSRDNEVRIDTNEEERLEFAKEILKSLVNDNAPHNDYMDSQEDGLLNHEMHDDDPEFVANDDDNEERSEIKIHPKKGRVLAKQLPEILRRLHQVLALHEEVRTIDEGNYNKKADVSPGDLRSLKQPIKLRLTQQEAPGSWKREKERSERDVTIFCEPLVSVDDLSHQILKTASNTHPEYVSFCRKLVNDSAIILERALSSTENVSRIAKIVSYNEKSGYHGVLYASNFSKGVGNCDCIDFRKGREASCLIYEADTTKLILSARKFLIVNWNQCSDEKSAFDMEQFLAEGIVGQNEESSVKDTLNIIGALVESDIKKLSSWASYTVVAVGTSDEHKKYDILSEDGEVICGVPANRINGIDSIKNNNAGTMRSAERSAWPNSAARRSFEARGRDLSLSGAYSFMIAGRRQVAEAEGPGSSEHEKKKIGKQLLRRSWSALALVESMCPADVGTTPILDKESPSNPDVIKFTCSVGDRSIVTYVEENLLQFPPSLQVRFSSTQLLPSTEMTLISLLQKLNQGETCDFFRDEGHQIFYSIGFQPSTDGKWMNQMMIPKKLNTTNPKISRNVDVHNDPMDLDLKPFRDFMHQLNWATDDQTCKLTHIASLSDYDELGSKCEGFDEICVQCMEIIEFLARVNAKSLRGVKNDTGSVFVNQELSQKLSKQTEDPLFVVGRTVPEWCFTIPTLTPNIFSYDSRKLLLDRVAFGVSRSTLRQQDSKVNVGRLRQRMTTLRARAVELVSEAFSGGAEDPTALQLQADELYGMEEALAKRVRTAFRDEGWEEMSLQVAKAAIHRDSLLSDAMSIMDQYSSNSRLSRRRLEVRFDGESGFDAASGDEAGVTRGFYADIAEALMSCDTVAGVTFSSTCALGLGLKADLTSMPFKEASTTLKLPLWIPDIDSSGQVIIPTPRAAATNNFGIFPRPISKFHSQFSDVMKYFRFMGQLFAAAMRDGFMFPLPLSSSFLKLVQYSGETSLPQFDPDHGSRGSVGDGKEGGYVLSSDDLPRPGFLGGEVYAVERHICRILDRIDQEEPHLSEVEREREYHAVAIDKDFAREALGKNYDCSFNEYFQDRTFVDPLDPTQGITAHPLCTNGCDRSITIHNIREWITYAKYFMLHGGVIRQAAAFKAGVEDFFPSDYLRLFTSEELQRDVCGIGDDVDDWDEDDIKKLFKLDAKGATEAFVAVAAIGGNAEALGRRFDPASTTIKYVVKALLEASPKQRRQFLSFVTSVPIVTPGLIEIIPIVSSGGKFLPMRDPGCLPRANTCARRLYLPKFESFESFTQVIWAVVRAESKHKGFFEWNL